MGTSTTHTLVQAGKAAVAAVAAWLIADRLLNLPQPFLAPYAAVFLVEWTVYRSVRTSVQQVAAVGVAVVLAFVVSHVVPGTTAALGVAVVAGLLIGRLRVFGDGGQWIGVTAVLVLTATGTSQEVLLLDRLVETALGAVIGTAVNALLLPPSYTGWARAATRSLAHELRSVLLELADLLRRGRPGNAQVRRAHEAEHLVRDAEEAVGWSAEADRMNLRRRSTDETDGTALRTLRDTWPRVRQIAEVVAADADPDQVLCSVDDARRPEFAALLEDLAEVVRLQPERGVAPEGFGEAVDRCQEQLTALDEQPGARGSTALLLPVRQALDALR
jgi:hypothetical protein